MTRIYDSLGIVSPFVAHGKMLLQEMWNDDIDWDAEFNGNLQSRVDRFVSEIPLLPDMKIERICLLPNCEDVSIHVFVTLPLRGMVLSLM